MGKIIYQKEVRPKDFLNGVLICINKKIMLLNARTSELLVKYMML